MAKQQSKRRRKRYSARSAYAGDVKPTGVLGFLGSSGTVKVIFIAMVVALAVGGLASIFASGVLTGRTGHDNPQGFVIQDDDDEEETPVGNEPIEVRQYELPPALTIDPAKEYAATITTEAGVIEVELAPGTAPETVNNFVFLARDSFYDGLVFHFVSEAFQVIAGDPACTSEAASCRGTGGPGYDLTESVSGDFQAGTLGMANGSQFFIALTESEQFDSFTPFGQVVKGLDVAEALVLGSEIEKIEIFEQ